MKPGIYKLSDLRDRLKAGDRLTGHGDGYVCEAKPQDVVSVVTAADDVSFNIEGCAQGHGYPPITVEVLPRVAKVKKEAA